MKTKFLLINIVFIATMVLTSCSSTARVGALRSESQSVDQENASSVRTEIDFGAGDLELSGGAEKLLEADFNYNVAALKPELKYADGTLVVRQPDVKGLPDLRDITDYQNDWNLRLNNNVPMALKVDIGAGSGNLQLAGLSLSNLDITIGAGTYAIDLSGDWARDLAVTLDTGAAFITLRLPKDVGVRVVVDRGANLLDVKDLTQDGDVYTNAAYGVSKVTMRIDLQAGIGQITLEVEK